MLSSCWCEFIISNFFLTSSVYTCIFRAYEKVCIYVHFSMHLVYFISYDSQNTEDKHKQVIKVLRNKR